MTSKIRIRRRLIVGLLTLPFVVAACGGGRPKATPLPARPTTVHSAGPSTTSTATSATTSSTTIPRTHVLCTNGQIAISIQASYVGAGSAAEELGFLNVSKSPCTLNGYPGVAALNVQGQQIAQAGRSDSDGGPPTNVNLNPGQLAEALIQGSDGSIRTCGYFTRSFLVTPPNLTQSTQVTAKNASTAIGVSVGCPIWAYPVRPETTQPTSSG
jgi:hypothetical protein